jgi:hypothetical protein
MKKMHLIAIGAAVVLAAAYFGIQAYASRQAEKKLDQQLSKFAGVLDVEYRRVDADLIGRSVRISDVRLGSPGEDRKTRIAEIVVRDFDDTAEIPARLSLACRGIEIDLRHLRAEKARLQRLGFGDTLEGSFDIDYRYDSTQKELAVRKLAFGIRDAGEIEFSLRLGNIDLDPRQAIGLLFTYPQILVHEAKACYRDASLVPRLFKLRAENENTTTEESTAALIRGIDQEMAREKDEFTRQALAQVKRFIENPRSLSVSASPEKPQPVGRLLRVKAPGDLVRLLRVEIGS